ncbi:MAG TPA: sigma-70 family RNA polymerase sigma factor [Blastocatellia bacterium]|nr:sigma-70 family RNA polymerase sigma factor [Blastocatellia bacterium]
MPSPKDMMEPAPPTEAARNQDWIAQIEQIAAGDQAALAQFYDLTNRMAFGLILRILGDRASAEEVLLDVYTQVWRQAGTYRRERGTPLAWLTTIARTRALDRLRSGRQEMQRKESLDAATDVRSGAADPETTAASNEHQRLVRRALAELTVEQRQVLELAYFSGMSHSEIAAHLGQPLGTVKTRTRLGMMKLKELLAPVISRD